VGRTAVVAVPFEGVEGQVEVGVDEERGGWQGASDKT